MEELNFNKKTAIVGINFIVGWSIIGSLLYIMRDDFSPNLFQSLTFIANILLACGGLCLVFVGAKFLIFDNGGESLAPAKAEIAGNSGQSEEEVELRRKLNLITRKEKEINKLLSKGLKTDKKEILNHALEFLDEQKLVVKTRLLVFEYLAWENYALVMCQKMMAPDYLTESNTDFSNRVIREIISKGDSISSSWIKLRETSVFETVRQVFPRLTEILKTCRVILDEIENSEIAGVLKDVRQLEANTIPLLPESTTLKAVEILQEFQQRPLNQELLFEHLRIKSLKEIKNV